jgi:hypothetical protein
MLLPTPLNSAAEDHLFSGVIDEICQMPWETLSSDELMQTAKAYYYFSIQFRENLEIACRLRPQDQQLKSLRRGECNTDNLSPYPSICTAGEKLNHDEFMRRLLLLQPYPRDDYLTLVGEAYLARTRKLDNETRAISIASYEDTGLSRVFRAILRATDWRGEGSSAFKFFLERHIYFDSDEGEQHGALSRHLIPNDRILPLWQAFRDLFADAAPKLRLR